MDLGEFGFWLDEAVKSRAGRRAEALEDTRVAMWSDANDFKRAIEAMRSISLPVGHAEQTIRQNWENMKKQGRG